MSSISTEPVPASPTPSNPPADQAGAWRDVQRQSLEQVVRLSVECAQEEQEIESRHDVALARDKADYAEKTADTEDRYQQRLTELTATVADRQESLEGQYQSDISRLEEDHESASARLLRQRKEAEASLKKHVDETSWRAESVLITVQLEVDTDEQKAKQEQEAGKVELDALAALETTGKEILQHFGMEIPTEEIKLDHSFKQRLATEAPALLAEHRQRAVTIQREMQALSQPRAIAGILPITAIILVAAGGGVAGWFIPHDDQTRLLGAAIASISVLVLGLGGLAIYRHSKHAQIERMLEEMFGELAKSVAIARRAARIDPAPGIAAREKRVKEARRKREQDITVAKERGDLLLTKAELQYRASLEEEDQQYQSQRAAVEHEKIRAAAELVELRETTLREIETENSAARQQADAAHTATLAAAESEYAQASAALQEKWAAGLRAVTDLMAAGSGINPDLVDWNSPAWNNWQAPTSFSGQVRFGEMKVDLAQLTEQVPKKLRLPGSFSVPAMLALPGSASLLIETDHAGRAATTDAAQMVMARLLTQIPAGRVKFTIFDPVGLGQSFAGFMHLADHDESLVGSRIWTEREHMEQRLADLTEHMETIIQKYLRNEYATIDQYNAQAGELAEPLRFLVIADFPTGFEAESLRRLASIANTGPRCGVYTIILRDTRQTLPPGSRMEEIIARSVHLRYKAGTFTWADNVFERFPLVVDPPPDEKTLTRLMDVVGKAAKEAKRVEVPFQSIAPPIASFWSMSSKDELRVPIGKSGATRLQAMRLGVGVAQHALVAGKTGSGKSNLMHTIVTNLAMWYSPDEVEFYLVDFKKGVEFKTYATQQLPHARAIAVESDREFGLSVLQRVDAELSRRGNMFRDAGVQEISGYRDRTGLKLPRTILLIDEFQEFFSEDDKLGQESSGLLDRLVRQGRAFGIHVVLGSQTIGGSSGLARSTLGQIAVRVALQCTEADSQLILGDNNGAARLLTRPGEAVYNDAGGLVEANSPFQIAYLPDDQREGFLGKVREVAEKKQFKAAVASIVFEGNSAAPIRKNRRLMDLLERNDYPQVGSSVPAYVGEPVAIKEPTAVNFRRQSGANALLVGQAEESALAIVASMAASIAAQQKPGDAVFYLMDGTPADSPYFGLLEKVLGALPQESKVIGLKNVPEAVDEIAKIVASRQGADGHTGASIYLLLFGLQRYRILRQKEDDFSFSSKSEEPQAKPDKQFAEILTEGPALGVHSVIWTDTPITLERTLDRGTMRQFDFRVLFQMSASDSSNLIDSPLANRLGSHRALLYSEEQGTFEKFRPHEVPEAEWVDFLKKQFQRHQK